MLSEILDVMCGAGLLIVRIYSDVLALGTTLCFRFPLAILQTSFASLGLYSPRRKAFTSVFITGASVGLGAALAEAYAEPGVRLWITARCIPALERTKQVCEAKGARVTALQVDVRDKQGMQQAIAAAHNEKPLDLVIANAGISPTRDGLEESHL